ncbi:MAG TPA: RsmG family class I SAM-dependent methyltransferase [Acidimicrobiales bacterium]|nr:RsmG family class I SAM-dependent methyltransferase [Acidimicrobiales bacterium]
MLGRAQELGFIGNGDLEPHVQRALHMAAAVPGRPERALDLGSGGGLPGLPLALVYPTTHWLLLDGSTRRTGFLAEAVAELGLAGRVSVRAERAEDAARSDIRASFDLVAARSFGPPATTAECAAPFLRPGGRLVVAEPPGSTGQRWDPSGLARLGLGPATTVTEPSAVAVLVQERLCPAAYPRRNGVPAKRPLF